MILPLYAGEIQARALGVAAHAFNEQGETRRRRGRRARASPQPMPSMPVGFWNDTGRQRYLEIVLRSTIRASGGTAISSASTSAAAASCSAAPTPR